jgi:hypothetical protein
MTSGACHACVHASRVRGMDHWCRLRDAPAHGDGCYWFHDRDAGCPARCPMPDGNGTICLETGGLLPAGPCAADCGYRPVVERWRRCTPS